MPHCLSADETMARIHRDNVFLAWGLAAAWAPDDIERIFDLTTRLIRRDAGLTEPERDRT